MAPKIIDAAQLSGLMVPACVTGCSGDHSRCTTFIRSKPLYIAPLVGLAVALQMDGVVLTGY